MGKLLKYNGTPCRIRTYDLRLRSAWVFFFYPLKTN